MTRELLLYLVELPQQYFAYLVDTAYLSIARGGKN